MKAAGAAVKATTPSMEAAPACVTSATAMLGEC
jgi:hypothetical protein